MPPKRQMRAKYTSSIGLSVRPVMVKAVLPEAKSDRGITATGGHAYLRPFRRMESSGYECPPSFSADRRPSRDEKDELDT